MAPKASTAPAGAQCPWRVGPEFMRRAFLLVLAIGALVLAVGLLALGAFPPQPHPQQIQKVLPNDRFASPAPHPG